MRALPESARASGPAIVLPFPRTRNVGFVARHADRMTELSPITAEKHLTHQLAVQRETMIRRGIATALIEAELRMLEAAIRATSWGIVDSKPGGAAR